MKDDHDHDHDHGRGLMKLLRLLAHTHDRELESWKDSLPLFVCLALNVGYGAFQLSLGYQIWGSTILLADGMHNLTDGFSLSIPIVSLWLAARWLRASNILTRINYLLLIGLMVYAIVKAIGRIGQPESTQGLVASVTIPILNIEVGVGIAMAALAFGGVVINLASVLILNKRKGKGLNMMSAFMHQFVDLISSIFALIAGGLIDLTGKSIIDPILTIAISLALIAIVILSYILMMQDIASKKSSHAHVH